LQFKGKMPFDFKMGELRDVWGDLAGTELHFKGWIFDWYHQNTQNGTSVTKILDDGVKLKFLGRKLRTFKPQTPVTLYVSSWCVTMMFLGVVFIYSWLLREQMERRTMACTTDK
jgi:hypothetical protein